jgi:hypothetical protein
MATTPAASHPVLTALGSGLAGAAALTAIHETARRIDPDDAPRMDTYGRRAIAAGFRAVGAEPPHYEALQGMALAGDLLTNAAFYTLVAAGSPTTETAWVRGAALGAAAGIGAVVLPPLMGLGRKPRGTTPATQAMTVAWYLAGGLAAAGMYHLLNARER